MSAMSFSNCSLVLQRASDQDSFQECECGGAQGAMCMGYMLRGYMLLKSEKFVRFMLTFFFISLLFLLVFFRVFFFIDNHKSFINHKTTSIALFNNLLTNGTIVSSHKWCIRVFEFVVFLKEQKLLFFSSSQFDVCFFPLGFMVSDMFHIASSSK